MADDVTKAPEPIILGEVKTEVVEMKGILMLWERVGEFEVPDMGAVECGRSVTGLNFWVEHDGMKVGIAITPLMEQCVDILREQLKLRKAGEELAERAAADARGEKS